MSDAKQNAIPYYTKERCLKSAIAELIDDYEALKREVNELRAHNKYLESRISEESDCAALLSRHNALVEAVAWERECSQDIRPLVAWAGLYVLHGEDYVDAVAEALREIQDAARAEVDRLLQEEK